MTDQTPQLQEPAVTLPPNAPLVRVTAGVGSAGQKTWNLRRPVTLIGSSRPAHIVLHDRDISKAHCVIVNTGTDVLVKDLRTSSGTLCNRNPIDVAVLADGDVITVGSNSIQVAINLPEGAADDSSVGLEFVDPVKFPRPIDVRLIHTDQQWMIEDAIVVIGRHEKATIRLDHEDVSTRHAVIFRFGDRPAVFDLGGRTGVWVNGKRTSIAVLSDGDCVTVGPFGLSIGSPDLAALRQGGGASAVDPILEAVLPGAKVAPDAVGESGMVPPAGASVSHTSGDGVATDSEATQHAGEEPIGEKIGETWERLNEWSHASNAESEEHAAREEALAARAAELDARDAALRGQLHDVTRMHEKLLEKEKELERLRALIERESAELEKARVQFAEREADLEQRIAEVRRRENALTQRWSRLRSATCAHCGKPVSTPKPPA